MISMRSTYINQFDLNLLPPLVALPEERHVSRAAKRVQGLPFRWDWPRN